MGCMRKYRLVQVFHSGGECLSWYLYLRISFFFFIPACVYAPSSSIPSRHTATRTNGLVQTYSRNWFKFFRGSETRPLETKVGSDPLHAVLPWSRSASTGVRIEFFIVEVTCDTTRGPADLRTSLYLRIHPTTIYPQSKGILEIYLSLTLGIGNM